MIGNNTMTDGGAGNTSLENIDGEVYSAMQRGDETLLRSRFAGRHLTEAEMALLVQARRNEEIIAYVEKKEREDGAAEARREEKREEWRESQFIPPASTAADSGAPVKDEYGGYESGGGVYHDKFGGVYDGGVYRDRNGSCKSRLGDKLDAKSGELVDRHGRKIELPKDAKTLSDKEDVMRARAAVAAVKEGKDPNAPLSAQEKAEAAGGHGGAFEKPSLRELDKKDDEVWRFMHHHCPKHHRYKKDDVNKAQKGLHEWHLRYGMNAEYRPEKDTVAIAAAPAPKPPATPHP